MKRRYHASRNFGVAATVVGTAFAASLLATNRNRKAI